MKAAEREDSRLDEVARRLRRAEKRVRRVEDDMRMGRHADDIADAVERLSSLAATGSPVVAGPWTGEVGFELLYWIPFLNWALEVQPDIAHGLIAISRGGASPWYRHLAQSYREIYDYVPPQEFLAEQRATSKQVDLSAFEEHLLERVSKDEGRKLELLHPSWMYEPLLRFTRYGVAGRFREVARYRPFERPGLGPLDGALPAEYAAVRFYFNNSFPETAENRQLANEVIARLAAEGDVVVLNTGFQLDDHIELAADQGRVTTIDRYMTPANNLEMQSIAISRARLFVGTYGGLSYLPAFYGVPSVSLYSDRSQFLPHHLEFAQAVFRESDLGDYLALDTRQLDVLGLLVR